MQELEQRKSGRITNVTVKKKKRKREYRQKTASRKDMCTTQQVIEEKMGEYHVKQNKENKSIDRK